MYPRAKLLVMGRDVGAAEPQPNHAPGKSQTQSLHSHSSEGEVPQAQAMHPRGTSEQLSVPSALQKATEAL